MQPFRDILFRRETRAAALIGVSFFLVGLLRINDLSLYTDSTRYLIFGNSLAELKGYVDETRPVPSDFVLNAPLYPLLLAPVEIFFPMSVEASKIWTLLWASFGLGLFFCWLHSRFSLRVSLATTSLLALNSLFLVTSTEILSEAPFFVFLVAIFWTSDLYFSDRRTETFRWIFIGTLAVLPLLREVGIAFVLAGLVALFRKKAGKDFVVLLIASAFFTMAWAIRNTLAASAEPGEATNTQFLFQHFATSPDGSVVTEFATRILLYLKGYGLNIAGSIFFPFPESLIVDPGALYTGLAPVLKSLSIPILLIAAVLVIQGIREDLQSGQAGFLRFAGTTMYLAIIMVYPVFDVRFLAPLLPVVLYYSLLALRQIASHISSAIVRRGGSVLLVSVILIPNLIADFELLRTNLLYRGNPTRPYVSSNGAVHFGQPWGEMGAWIRANIPDSVVLASPAKEPVPFIGKRKLLETSRTLPTPIVERFLRDHDARYLLTTTLWDDLETFAVTMAETRRFWFKQVHSVGHLKLYEIHSALLETPPKSEPVAYDTSGIRGLLLRGRYHLQELLYAEAVADFQKAVQNAPFRPEPVFHLMSAVSIVGDSSSAMALFERLFTLPQSTAYTQLARAMIVTMEKLLRAQQQSSLQRSHTAFEGGLAYWQLGFSGPALAVMRNIAKSDSLHFVSALWGAYFARQLGDTVESNEFLKRLNKIDKNAAIVTDWNSLKSLEERIKRTRDAAEKAALHMRIAQIFSKLELYEEALDALERAERTAPEMLIDILLARAEIYEKKQVAVAAVRSYRSVLELEPHNSFARGKLESLAM